MDIESEVVFPYIYGSMAFSLGKKSETHQTHKWICYVRGVNNEDLSYLIERVEFVLHSSFEKPVRSNAMVIQLWKNLHLKSKKTAGANSKY